MKTTLGVCGAAVGRLFAPVGLQEGCPGASRAAVVLVWASLDLTWDCFEALWGCSGLMWAAGGRRGAGLDFRGVAVELLWALVGLQ